jgi:hypothetical protein
LEIGKELRVFAFIEGPHGLYARDLAVEIRVGDALVPCGDELIAEGHQEIV